MRLLWFLMLGFGAMTLNLTFLSLELDPLHSIHFLT